MELDFLNRMSDMNKSHIAASILARLRDAAYFDSICGQFAGEFGGKGPLVLSMEARIYTIHLYLELPHVDRRAVQTSFL